MTKVPKWVKDPEFGFMSLEECLNHFSEFIDHEVKAQIKINEEFKDGWTGSDQEIEQLKADEIQNFKDEIRSNTFTFDPEITHYFNDQKIAVNGWFDQ